MKNTISGYLLIMLMVVGVFKSLIPFVEYSLNQGYIVNQLCVNRNIPESGCKGKCYLKKKVSQILVPSVSSEIPSIPLKTVIPDLSKFLKLAKLEWNSLAVSAKHIFPKQFILYSCQLVLKIIKPPELNT